jgi:TP901 family phage tail tape measure protein
MAQTLQNLVYEIGYVVNDSGLEKSTQLIGSLESSLNNFMKDVDSATSAFNKFNEPIGTLSKSTSDLNVNNLSDSLKKSQENSDGLNSSTERLERLTKLVNDYADEYNSKIDRSSQLAQEWNNRTTPLSKTLSEINAEQQKLNDEIFKTNSEEEQTATTMNKVADGIKRSTAGAGELASSMRSVRTISSGLSNILGAFGFVGIGYEAVRGVQAAIGSFIEFQQQMARVHATLGQISNNDLANLSNQAIQISNTWGISSKEIGAGMESLASHGFNLKQIMASIEPATLLAVAGNIKMEDATLDISSAIRNFNLDVSKASHVTDVYAKAAMDTAAAMPDMATAMSYIAPVASQAGWSIENTAAAIGELGNKGILGSKAGMGLLEMYTRLVKPTKNATSLMKELGFSAIDPTIHKMKDIGNIIGDLNTSLHGLNPAVKNTALSVIFGQEALPKVTALLGVGKKAIDDETESLKHSNNAARDYANTVTDTLAGSLIILKSNIQNAFITSEGDTELGKALKSVVDGINNNMPVIKNNIQWVLTETVKVGSTIKRNWGGISSIVLGVASAFLTLKGAMAIEGVIKVLGGLKKSLPTVGMAAGIGLIATGFLEMKQGNTGLGALLIATGSGLAIISSVIKFGALKTGAFIALAAGFVEMKKGNTGLGALLIGTAGGLAAINILGLNKKGLLIGGAIGTAAAGFIELKKGNTGLGALLIGTAAGLAAINVFGIGKKGILTSGAIGVAAAGFVEMKKGNTGLGALLIGTAAGLAAVQVVAAPVAGGIGLIVAGLAYLIAKCGGVKEAWNALWKGAQSLAIDITQFIIGKINTIIGAIDNVIKLKNKIFGTDTALIPTLQLKEGVGITSSYSSGEKNSSRTMTGRLATNANGTNNFEGGLSLVGERGPEIVNIPRGSQVIPNNNIGKVSNTSQDVVSKYVNNNIIYGQNAVKNFSAGLLKGEPLATTATTKVSQDNKNIMNNLSLSGNTYGSGMINNMTQGVKDSEGNLNTTVQTLTDKVVETFRSGFGIHSPSTVMYGMGTNLMQGLVNGMTSKDMNAFVQGWIGSITSSAGGAVNGNLVGWLSAAMAITGTPMSYLPLLENIAMHESGGNPLAINLWDSNAMAGHPSKGLMQMIDGSFSRYAIPVLGDIYNPIANAAASIRYMLGTYGSISNVPGITSQLRGGGYVGYAQGTENASPGVHLVGEKGPELVWMKGGEKVTPNNEIDDEINKVRTPYNAIHNAKVENNTTFQVIINGSGKNAKDIAEEVDRTLRRKFGGYFDDKMSTLKIQMGLE